MHVYVCVCVCVFGGGGCMWLQHWRKQLRYFLGWDFKVNLRADKAALAVAYRGLVERVMEGDFALPQQPPKPDKN